MDTDSRASLLTLMEEVNLFFRKGAHDIQNLLLMVRLLLDGNNETDKDQTMQLLEKLEKHYRGEIDHLRASFDEFRSIRANSTSFKRVNVSSLINTVLDEMSSELPKETVIETTLDQKAELIYSEEHLKNAIRALLDNAVRYAQPNLAPTINISAEPVGEGVRVSLQDNGSGIDLSRNGDRLFQPFVRCTTQSEGEGISLFLVKTLVEGNGGSISITSQVGEGTTVTLLLASQLETKEQ